MAAERTRQEPSQSVHEWSASDPTTAFSRARALEKSPRAYASYAFRPFTPCTRIRAGDPTLLDVADDATAAAVAASTTSTLGLPNGASGPSPESPDEPSETLATLHGCANTAGAVPGITPVSDRECRNASATSIHHTTRSSSHPSSDTTPSPTKSTPASTFWHPAALWSSTRTRCDVSRYSPSSTARSSDMCPTPARARSCARKCDASSETSRARHTPSRTLRGKSQIRALIELHVPGGGTLPTAVPTTSSASRACTLAPSPNVHLLTDDISTLSALSSTALTACGYPDPSRRAATNTGLAPPSEYTSEGPFSASPFFFFFFPPPPPPPLSPPPPLRLTDAFSAAATVLALTTPTEDASSAGAPHPPERDGSTRGPCAVSTNALSPMAHSLKNRPRSNARAYPTASGSSIRSSGNTTLASMVGNRNPSPRARSPRITTSMAGGTPSEPAIDWIISPSAERTRDEYSSMSPPSNTLRALSIRSFSSDPSIDPGNASASARETLDSTYASRAWSPASPDE